jgi:predicted NBD/HSP70 family sugar kinase
LSTQRTKSGGEAGPFAWRTWRGAAAPVARTGPIARTEFPAKATHAQTRAHNAALVLRALYDLGPISRADIARLTGLTRTSVGELVSDLERERLATDVGRGPSTGGKQPTLVALNANARTIITLDLGERTFTAALANLRGEIAARTTRDLEGRDGQRALDVVHELIDEVRAAATSPILGIGVGTPGIVDGTGTIRWAVSLDWQDLPLAQILSDRHGLPTVVANDSRAAAFATYLFKGDERPPNLAVIKVGRGIGAGLILRDQLFGGDGEAAGEIGHVVVDPDGDACHCGRFGCLETVASAPAVIRASGERSLEALATRAAAGDDQALGIVRASGRALGGAIAHLVGALDIRHITVVGTATTLGEPWLEAIRQEATSRSLAATGQETTIEDGGTGEDVTLLGACALLLTRELGLTVHR